MSNLYLSCLWQATHLAGFWVVILFVPVYKGAIVDHRYHTSILGIDENIFVFLVLTIVLCLVILWIKMKVAPFDKSDGDV